MILGREVCVGVAFLRRARLSLTRSAFKLRLTAAPMVASTHKSVAAPTTRTVATPRSDKRSPDSVSKKLPVALLGGCGLAREQDPMSLAGRHASRGVARACGGLPLLLPADQIFFALTAVTRAEPVQSDGTPWFLGTGL